MCSIFFIGIVEADWNSGVTIEDMSTRISVNILSDGVQVTVDFSEHALALLKEDNIDPFEGIIKGVIAVHTKQALIPNIKTEGTDELSTTIFFPFLGEKPSQLNIIPAFDVINKAGKHSIITVAHQGLPVIDHGVLTAPEILVLDWDDPWYSHFLNLDLKRDHGDPVMAFLYIEPQQIKTEIVVRVKEMAEWTDLGLRDKKVIHPDEFELLKNKVGQFLFEKNKISADSQILPSTLKQVDYIKMGAADIQAYEPQEVQQQAATLIGVSILQPIQSIPNKIQWEWSLFNKKMQRISIRAYDSAGLFDSYVTPDYRIFEWENMLADIDLQDSADKPHSVPVEESHNQDIFQSYWLLGMVCLAVLLVISSKLFSLKVKVFILILMLAVGYYFLKTGQLAFNTSSRLNEQQANPVLKQLLWNVYQAFESTQEDKAYENLAYSIKGGLQETLYLQNRKALLSQDGAHSKVKEVKIKSLNHLPASTGDGSLFDCEWFVIGDVIHWGHQHRRENLYRAQIKLIEVDGFWKIIELESIGQQRVD